MNSSSSVFAPTNIALAKYWGKRDQTLNLPTNSSISVTLDHYGSTTAVEFSNQLTDDSFELNGSLITDQKSLKKVSTVLNIFRKLAKTNLYANVRSANNFPTGAGLASSASGIAALTFAANHALDLRLAPSELSTIARQGSGSASRSLFEGFVEWQQGSQEDGTDSYANSIAASTHWNIDILICVVDAEKKKTLSTDGMIHTQMTSPLFQSWVQYAKESTPLIRSAILKKDFKKLAELSEQNCTMMHASAMSSTPSIQYWQPKTLELMSCIQNLRQTGTQAFYTIDAGPNVVIFCEPQSTETVLNAVMPIVSTCLKTKIGTGPRLL